MVLKEDRKSVKAHVAMVNLTLILLCFNPFLLFSIELTVVLFFYAFTEWRFSPFCWPVSLFFYIFSSVLYFRREKKSWTDINSRLHNWFHNVCLYKCVCINVCKMIANQFSCLFCSILKVLEVVAPFKHFNKLKEFVAMKLPAGFPVRIGWCGLYLLLKIASL